MALHEFEGVPTRLGCVAKVQLLVRTLAMHKFGGVPTRLGRVAKIQLLVRTFKWVTRLGPLQRSRMLPCQRS